jgi:hypothetical protein
MSEALSCHTSSQSFEEQINESLISQANCLWSTLTADAHEWLCIESFFFVPVSHGHITPLRSGLVYIKNDYMTTLVLLRLPEFEVFL